MKRKAGDGEDGGGKDGGSKDGGGKKGRKSAEDKAESLAADMETA